jgi:hypothetical protein
LGCNLKPPIEEPVLGLDPRMTETTMNLRAQVEKAPDADALREMISRT